MIRAEKFLVSRPLYAVDLASYHLADDGRSGIGAAWFRRRKGVTVACVGEVWNYLQPRPRTAEAFLVAHDDNRYGGDCLARWDGSNLWSNADESQRREYFRVLLPMLDAYPAVPEGFSGWWGFA